AGGVRRPLAARGAGLPVRETQGGGAADRQRAVAPWRADKRDAGPEPALEVQAPAKLQPAVESDRTLLEENEAEGHAKPAIRQPGGPEALTPRQPQLLPDRPDEGRLLAATSPA